MERKFINFLNKYESLGHMTQIDPNEVSDISPGIFYLPHHGVINESSLTTKLRVVFDGSCKSTPNISFNDLLKVGPTTQRDLFTILLRFRKQNVAVTGDIDKMYRQIQVIEEQRDLQRIVWRTNENQKIKHYRLNTYRTSSAFLAIRCLQQIGFEKEKRFPLESHAIINDFYVDDLLTGAANIQDAINLKQNLAILLKSYGLHPRKWGSNRSEVLDQNYFSLNHCNEVTIFANELI